VIKVESPGRGDEFRHYPPVHPKMPAQGAPHMWTNRNKRSLAVNLKTPEGIAVIKELIAHADVFAEKAVFDDDGLAQVPLQRLLQAAHQHVAPKPAK
jgi:crotonobetainyl-CoA:carnitine CoA-transferase CaiB-like acyl-CoA transferase